MPVRTGKLSSVPIYFVDRTIGSGYSILAFTSKVFRSLYCWGSSFGWLCGVFVLLVCGVAFWLYRLSRIVPVLRLTLLSQSFTGFFRNSASSAIFSSSGAVLNLFASADGLWPNVCTYSCNFGVNFLGLSINLSIVPALRRCL